MNNIISELKRKQAPPKENQKKAKKQLLAELKKLKEMVIRDFK